MRLSTGGLLAAFGLMALASLLFGGGGGGGGTVVVPTRSYASLAAAERPAKAGDSVLLRHGGEMRRQRHDFARARHADRRAATETAAPAAAAAVAPAVASSDGAGPAAGPAGTTAERRSEASRLDGTLEAALRVAVPGGPGFVMASFANSALNDHLINFVVFAKKAAAPFVIGAVDAAAYAMLAARDDAPTYLTPLAKGGFSLDGGNSHSSGSWKAFAGMRTGEVARIVALGYAVLHTDVDVIWLQSPEPFLMCAGEAARAGGEHGPAARFPCAPLLSADVAVSSDNMSPGRDTEGRAQYSAGGTFNTGLLFIRPTTKGREFVGEWHTSVVSPARGSRFAALTSDQQVFNHMMRKPGWPGIDAEHGAATMREAWGGRVTLGALPLALFMNGHGYFVQRAHERLGVSPFAAHATYSLDRHDGVAKRQRFREAALWAADPPAYFEGSFLALGFSTPPAVQARLDHYGRSKAPPTNIDTHARSLEAYAGELRDALALARALGRTLVLPRWVCYCDRLWSGSDDIFHFGCMYPGAQDGAFVPFTCPMDHVLSPAAWEAEGISYRDAAFLDAPRFRAPGAIRELTLVPRHAWAAGDDAAALPLGMSAAEARALLKPLEGVPVLRLPHARGLLCSVDDPREFNALARRVLRLPSWCAKCFQPCEKELAKWLPSDEIKQGSQWGQSFCLPQKPVPSFSAGLCSLNTAMTG